MEKVLVLLLLAFASTESFRYQRDANLETGAVCSHSSQCRSGCCRRYFGETTVQCAEQNAEGQECSPKPIFGTYYQCPCHSGLTCEPKASPLGLPGDFGTCRK